MLCSSHAVQRKLVLWVTAVRINSLILRKGVSVASVICLGLLGGLFLVLLLFSSRSNSDDKYQHEMSNTL